MTHAHPFPKKHKRKQVVAGATAFVFLYSTLAAPLAEANFWHERRQEVLAQKKASSGERSELYAQLPKSLPEINQAFPALRQDQTFSGSARLSAAGTPDAPAGRLQQLPRWLTAVPLHYGDIRKMHLAPDAARRPLVIHIQDAHDHYEAQKNIGAMISEMAAKGGVSLIGLEGAHGGFNLKPYRDFPDRGIVGDVADFLLREHFIGGAELAAWTSEKDLPLWGVEDPGLYLANIRAFKDSVPVQADLSEALRGLRMETERLKGRLYTPSLQEFGYRQARYREGSLDLGAYVRYLRGLSNPPAGRFPNLDLFVQVLAMEESLDFSLVEKERLDLIKELAGSLSKEQLSVLVQKSLLYRSGRLSYGAYYDDLRTLCRGSGVELGSFPRMERYIQYVLAAERIEREVLLSELKGLEDGTLAPLLLTREQKNLQELSDDLSLAQRLSEFKMTPDDWALYDRRRSEIHSMPRRLRSLQEPLGLKAQGAGSPDVTPDLLRPFEDFCRYALRRNQALIDGLLAKMSADKGRAAVLVAGGFHTEGLTALMRRKNVSYVVMTPRIKEIKEGVRSLDFLRERPSLEKLFSGEKVTLKTPLVLGVAPTPGYPSGPGERLAKCLLGALWAAEHEGADPALSPIREVLERMPGADVAVEITMKEGDSFWVTLKVKPGSGERRMPEVLVDLSPENTEDIKALLKDIKRPVLYQGEIGRRKVMITAPSREPLLQQLMSWSASLLAKRQGPGSQGRPVEGPAAVTGAGGFIGSNLAKALENQGVKTRVLSRDEARLRARGVSSPAVTGDLLDRAAVKSLVESSDVIYHLAAVSDANAAREDPVEAAASTALGTALVAWQAEQEGKRVVHASSQLVLAAGGVADGRVDENADLPVFDRPEVALWLGRLEEDFWAYAQSYMAGDADAEQDPRKFVERYLDKRPIPQLKNHPNPDHLRRHAYGLFKYSAERFVAKTERGVNVRLANNYGPGDATGTKMDMLTRGMLANKDFVGPSALWPDERQYLYVEDLVRLLIKIGSLKSPPKVVNVASARLTRTPLLARLVKRLAGSYSRLEIDQNAPIRPFSLDTTLLETLVGPLDETPLETGVEKTIASLRVERSLALYPEKYREIVRRSPPSLIPGARDALLRSLQGAGVPLFLASGGERGVVLETLSEAGLRSYFPENAIFSAETPKTEALRRARSAAEPDGTIVMVGDGAHDMAAGAAVRDEARVVTIFRGAGREAPPHADYSAENFTGFRFEAGNRAIVLPDGRRIAGVAAVVLDLDGTLVDNVGLSIEAHVVALLETLGHKRGSAEFERIAPALREHGRGFLGVPAREFVAELLRKAREIAPAVSTEVPASLAADALQAYQRAYSRLIPELPLALSPGADTLLSRMSTVHKSIVTDDLPIDVNITLDRSGLRHRIPADRVHANNGSRKKVINEVRGLRPRAVSVVISANPRDMEAAFAAKEEGTEGIVSVFVGDMDEARRQALSVDYVVPNLGQLAWINDMHGHLAVHEPGKPEETVKNVGSAVWGLEGTLVDMKSSPVDNLHFVIQASIQAVAEVLGLDMDSDDFKALAPALEAKGRSMVGRTAQPFVTGMLAEAMRVRAGLPTTAAPEESSPALLSHPLTRWQLLAGIAGAAALGVGIFGLSWAALAVPAFGALGVLVHELGHFLAYEALRKFLKSGEPRARLGFQPFHRGVWVETGDLGRGANAFVAAAGILATGFLAAATGFDASSPVSLAGMALTTVGVMPLGWGSDIERVARSLAGHQPGRPFSKILRSKIRNLQQVKDIAARSEGPSQVVAITNGGDGEIVRQDLMASAPRLFRADGGAKVFTHEESPQRGQFLGLLDAIRNLRRSGRPLDFEGVPLGVMLPGSGTRMSPLTQRAHGIKPSLPMLVRAGSGQPWMSGAEASLYSWVLVAHHLKRMGFKGMAWKWGDEPQVPVEVLADMDEDFGQVDAVRFGAPVPVTDDLARQKEWLYVNPQTGEFQQVHRRPRAELLARMGHRNPDQEVTAVAHIGSPAFSDVFLEAAEEVFGRTAGVMDVDGYLFEALTHDEATLRADLREDAKFAALLSAHPDFYEKVQELKRRINEKRGRPAEAPLNIKVIDFGEGLYWGDIGQLAKARATLWAVNDRYSEEGEFARRLAALEDVKPDKFNNIVVGDSLVPQDGGVRNSVIIDTKIYGPSDVDGAVLVDSRLGEARVEQGSVVFGSTVLRLRMGQNALSYASIEGAAEEADALDIPRDGVHTSIPADPADVSRGLEDWRADSAVDVGAKENYTSAKFGNPGSFEEKFKQMRQRAVPPAEVERAVGERFRDPLIELMETSYFRGKKPKHLAFGTSGLRGLVTDITDLEAYINARGFLDYLLSIPVEEGGIRLDPTGSTYISIAGDLRSSTPRIMKAVARAIEDAGFKVENLGFIPTPALTYHAMQKGRASVMVTGSHIPFDRNGIKFNKVNGEVLKPDEAGILRNVAAVRRAEYARPPKDSLFRDDGLFRRGRAPRLPTVNRQAEAAYKQRYLDIFAGNPLKGMNVVVFQHSGVGRDIVVDILKGLGAKVYPAGRSKEFIPIDTENIDEEQLARLQALADQQARKAGVKMDAVISFDGDTDRPLVAGVNEAGEVEFFNGDVLGVVTASFVGADFAAVPRSATLGVEMELTEKHNVPVKRTKIGSPYVVAAMSEAAGTGRYGKIVSWEVNGGFLTGTDVSVGVGVLKALPTRDAVLPILAALISGKQAGGLANRFNRLPERRSRAGLLDKFPVETSRDIVRRFSETQVEGLEEAHFEEGSIRLVYVDERSDTIPESDESARPLLAIKRQLEVFFSSAQGEHPLFEGGIKWISFLDAVYIHFESGDSAMFRPSGNAPQFRIYSDGLPARAERIVQLGKKEPDGILRRIERWVQERTAAKSVRSALLAAKGVVGAYFLSVLSVSVTISVVVSLAVPVYLPSAIVASALAVLAAGAAGWRRGRFHREQAVRLAAAAEGVRGLPKEERESYEGLNARLKKGETHYVDGRRGKQSFTVVHNPRLEAAAEARGLSEMAVNPLIMSRLSNMEQRSILHHEARHIEFRVNHPRLAGLPFIGSLIEELVVSRRDVIDGDEVYLSFAQDVFALIQGQVEGAAKWTPLARRLDLSVAMKSEDRDQAVREALAVLRQDVDLVSARYLLAKLRPALAGRRGNGLLRELGWTAEEAATILRLLQYLVLSQEPVQTDPHFAFYEWYGQILKTLHGTDKPPSQTWPFFSDAPGIGPADIADTAIVIGGKQVMKPLSMRNLVLRAPDVLGPEGADPANNNQKYFFVKFMDTSDFPPFAHVGFNPEALAALRRQWVWHNRSGSEYSTEGQFEADFRRYFAGLLKRDRELTEDLRDRVRVRTEEEFQSFKDAYKAWAISQAEADWAGEAVVDFSPFTENGKGAEAARVLDEQKKVRFEIARLMHKIPFQENQAILIETPTVHAIAGLSLQIHPPDQPKDELWIHKMIYDDKDRPIGALLVEPQRTFDKTDSGADFYTPFAWHGEEGLGFRKNMTPEFLDGFAAGMDATPRPAEHYLRSNEPMDVPGAVNEGGAGWHRSVDEDAWPYFLVRELRFDRAGRSRTPLEHHSFVEIHATRGEVEITLKRQGQPSRTVTVTPKKPVFLPAGLPYDTIEYASNGPAELLYFARRPAASADTEEQAETKVDSIEMPPAQKERQRRFNEEGAKEWINKLLARIPGRNPLEDQEALVEANRIDHVYPDLKPGNVRPAKPESIVDILGELTEEDLYTVKSFSGGVRGASLYDQIQPRGKRSFWRELFRSSPVDKVIRDRLSGRTVDITLLGGVATRLAKLNKGKPVYFFSLREIMTAPMEEFDGEDIRAFVLGLRERSDAGQLEGLDLDMPYGRWLFWAYRVESERLVREANKRTDQWKKRHPVANWLLRTASFGLWNPYYDPQTAVDNKKFIIHVNQEAGPEIIRDMAREDFFGFNLENIVFLFQDVYNSWEYDPQSGELTRDPDHKRVFGHGQLLYDQVVPGIAFLMEKAADGRYVQKFISQDAMDYMMERGGRMASVEEVGDVNMLVNPLKLGQDVAARVNFDRGYTYVGRVAENLTKQKGGYAVEDEDGRQVILEQYLIEGRDYDHLRGSMLNFWGIRYMIKPIARKLRKSKPFYTLDVRENAQKRKRLAIETYMSNLGLLGIGARFRSLSAFLSRTGFPVGIRFKAVFLPGDAGTTFKKPESLEHVISAYRQQGEAVDSVRSGSELAQEGAQPPARLEDFLVPNVGVQSVGLEGRYPSLVVTQLLEAPSFLKITASAFFRQRESIEQGDSKYDRISAPTFLRTSPYWAEAERDKFFRWAKENPVKARALHEQIQVQLARQNMADPVKWSEREAGLVALAMAMGLMDEESIQNGRAQALVDVYNREMRIQEEAAGAGTSDERLAPVSGSAAGRFSRSGGILQRIARLLNLDFNIIHLPVVARVEDGRLAWSPLADSEEARERFLADLRRAMQNLNAERPDKTVILPDATEANADEALSFILEELGREVPPGYTRDVWDERLKASSAFFRGRILTERNVPGLEQGGRIRMAAVARRMAGPLWRWAALDILTVSAGRLDLDGLGRRRVALYIVNLLGGVARATGSLGKSLEEARHILIQA